MRIFIFSVVILLIHLNPLSAQTERALAREGNKLYKRNSFTEAELRYKRSLRKNEDANLEAVAYNLGNALTQQKRYDEAVEQFNEIVNTNPNKATRAKAFHNLGNVYMEQKNYEDALEMYKETLRINPQDDDARYNLAYAKELLKNESEEQKEERQEESQCDNPKESDEQKDQEKKEQEKKDQEKKDQEEKEKQEQKDQEQKDQEKKDQEQKDDQEKSEEEKEQEKKEQEEKEGEEELTEEQKKEQEAKRDSMNANPPEKSQGPPKEVQLSKEEIMRLLEAMKNEEAKVQEKLHNKKNRGQSINIDKDW